MIAGMAACPAAGRGLFLLWLLPDGPQQWVAAQWAWRRGEAATAVPRGKPWVACFVNIRLLSTEKDAEP